MANLEEVELRMSEAFDLLESVGFEVEYLGEAEALLDLLEAALISEDLDTRQYLVLEAAFATFSRAWRTARKKARKFGVKASDLWRRASFELGLGDHPLYRKVDKQSDQLDKILKKYNAAVKAGKQTSAERHKSAFIKVHKRQQKLLNMINRASSQLNT